MASESKEVTIGTPALGPSLLVAPSGKCIWTEYYSSVLLVLINGVQSYADPDLDRNLDVFFELRQ